MKPNNRKLGLSALGLSAIFLLLTQCNKEDFEPLDFIFARTIEASIEDVNTVRLIGLIELDQGELANIQGNLAQEYGFLLSTSNPEPSISDPQTQKIKVGDAFPADGRFVSEQTGLSLDEVYFFRAYAKLGARESLGDVDDFGLSDNVQVGIVQVSEAENIDNDRATINGLLILKFQSEITDHGLILSTSGTRPDVGSAGATTIRLGPTNNDGVFETVFPDLDFNTDYTAWAFAQIGQETFYSSSTSFRTGGGWKKFAILDDVFVREAVGTALSGKGYFGMGCDLLQCTEETGRFSTNRIWEIDPVNDRGAKTFAEKERGNSGRVDAIGFALNDKMYFGLGQVFGAGPQSENTYFTDFWEFDPSMGNGVWTEKDSFPGGIRVDAVAFALDGLGYVGTGLDPEEDYFYDDFWIFDPAAESGSQWSSLPNTLPISFEGETFSEAGRSGAFAFTINDEKAYVGAGADSGGELNDLWEFDARSKIWILMGEGPYELRKEAVAFAVNGKGYMGLGETGSGEQFFDLWEFDPMLNGGQWSQRTEFQTDSLKASFAFSIDGKGFVGGVNDLFNSMDIWEYTPEEQ